MSNGRCLLVITVVIVVPVAIPTIVIRLSLKRLMKKKYSFHTIVVGSMYFEHLFADRWSMIDDRLHKINFLVFLLLHRHHTHDDDHATPVASSTTHYLRPVLIPSNDGDVM